MEKKKTHTLIISDLHLGSAVSQPQKALKVLEEYNFRKLILLGDIFDNLNFNKLSPECWRFLNYVGHLAHNDNRKVRWVVGNHDNGLADIFGTLLNARIYESYAWQFKREKYIAVHGHQFDRFLVDNAFISWLATRIYDIVQRMDSEEKKLSHYLKRKSKGWLRLSEKVARSAIRYGRKNGVQYVFCGHTHKADKKIKKDIAYYNSGCWADTPCSYVTIDEDDIKIHTY